MSEREQEDIKPFLNGPTAKEQRGSAAGDKENSTHSHIEVTLEFEGDHMKFKVKESTKVNKIKSTFCERRNLKADSLRCHNEDGERLEDVRTAACNHLKSSSHAQPKYGKIYAIQLTFLP